MLINDLFVDWNKSYKEGQESASIGDYAWGPSSGKHILPYTIGYLLQSFPRPNLRMEDVSPEERKKSSLVSVLKQIKIR